MFSDWLQRQWFGQRRLVPALWFLAPLSWLYAWVAERKRRTTRPVRLPVPVIVVGNITVGGAGKTPLTLWLVQQFRAQGWRPAIVSRGYGGRGSGPRPVLTESVAVDVGDEPILLARRSECPVWVGRDRVATGRALLAAHPEVNVIVCDDGLQHYRLARDVELAVFDGRGIGNGWRLPAGPLREPPTRLVTVDAVVLNTANDLPLPGGRPAFQMRLVLGEAYRLDAPSERRRLDEFVGQRLFALAGIGNPARFFDALTARGLSIEVHPFPDHHAYCPADLAFASNGILLMTEKDAVKCQGLSPGEIWVVPVDAEMSTGLIELILEKLRGRQAP